MSDPVIAANEILRLSSGERIPGSIFTVLEELRDEVLALRRESRRRKQLLETLLPDPPDPVETQA